MPADAVPTAAAVSKIADLIMADGLRSVVGGVWGFDGWGTRDGAAGVEYVNECEGGSAG